eukprot:TRINITY_DN6166_c0_g1_i1.p1 TRINITY_DN6166_c0_g1~~TRINITY_DN6166_c0_g1_i1.p1  ORF type:complete len:610 (-),score=80.08 TRINITY_DN6166_c0_g1_i1:202-2031(-)
MSSLTQKPSLAVLKLCYLGNYVLASPSCFKNARTLQLPHISLSLLLSGVGNCYCSGKWNRCDPFTRTTFVSTRNVSSRVSKSFEQFLDASDAKEGQTFNKESLKNENKGSFSDSHGISNPEWGEEETFPVSSAKKSVAINRFLDKELERISLILTEIGVLNPKARLALENSGLGARLDLVEELLNRYRNDWNSAYTVFSWAGSQEGYKHSVNLYHTMLAILSKAKQFRLAWKLIKEMHRRRILNQQTLLLIIRRYSAAKEVDKAVKTFQSTEKFGLKLNIDFFQGLLGALCRYGNVEDAEKLLYQYKSVFEYEAKSFNIVLSGWCNRVINAKEAKRFWKIMLNNNIQPDVYSYTSMIGCLSKAGQLSDVLKFFDTMKEKGYVLDLKVYNSVIYALAKGRCVKEAYNLLDVMLQNGLRPNSMTYNSLIKPLCKAKEIEEACSVLDDMVQQGQSPTLRTFHAFINSAKTSDECLEVLNIMKEKRCIPTLDTYNLLKRRLSYWRDRESFSKLLNDMRKNEDLCHDRAYYTALIQGHFLNGNITEACKYYKEMECNGFTAEPRTARMLKDWVSIDNRSTTSPVFNFKLGLAKWESEQARRSAFLRRQRKADKQ